MYVKYRLNTEKILDGDERSVWEGVILREARITAKNTTKSNLEEKFQAELQAILQWVWIQK